MSNDELVSLLIRVLGIRLDQVQVLPDITDPDGAQRFVSLARPFLMSRILDLGDRREEWTVGHHYFWWRTEQSSQQVTHYEFMHRPPAFYSFHGLSHLEWPTDDITPVPFGEALRQGVVGMLENAAESDPSTLGVPLLDKLQKYLSIRGVHSRNPENPEGDLVWVSAQVRPVLPGFDSIEAVFEVHASDDLETVTDSSPEAVTWALGLAMGTIPPGVVFDWLTERYEQVAAFLAQLPS